MRILGLKAALLLPAIIRNGVPPVVFILIVLLRRCSAGLASANLDKGGVFVSFCLTSKLRACRGDSARGTDEALFVPLLSRETSTCSDQLLRIYYCNIDYLLLLIKAAGYIPFVSDAPSFSTFLISFERLGFYELLTFREAEIFSSMRSSSAIGRSASEPPAQFPYSEPSFVRTLGFLHI